MSCFTEGYVEFPSLDGWLESKWWNMSLSHNLHIYIYMVSLSLSLSLYTYIYILPQEAQEGHNCEDRFRRNRVLEAPATLRPARLLSENGGDEIGRPKCIWFRV